MIDSYKKFVWLGLLLFAGMLLGTTPGLSQTCSTGSELSPTVRSSLESTARQYFNMAAQGDVFNLKQNAIPAIANDFGGIERAVVDNRAGLSGGQPTIRNSYVLDAPGTAPIPSAEFFCGVFGAQGQTNNSAGFRIPNLPPGKYAVVIMDVNGTAGPYMLTQVLQEVNGAWKLAGFYAKPTQIDGHNADWFVNQARAYKAKGQNHDAWFYFLQARELAAPVPFMSTLQLDRLYDEAQQVMPTDLPVNGPVDFTGPDGQTWKLTQVFTVVVNGKLNLVAKYQAPDISDTAKALQGNIALMKALVAKYPEYREAFDAVVARAVAPSGQDYGTLLAMKDIK
jgi:hypothetical protein